MKIHSQDHKTAFRDLIRLRTNPQFFLNSLSNIDWSLLVNSVDVDEMENFWTTEINKCLDFVAPWKTRQNTQKKALFTKRSQRRDQKKKGFAKET